jgi:hypothetical protein
MAGGEQADFDRTERDGVWKPMGRASYIGPSYFIASDTSAMVTGFG